MGMNRLDIVAPRPDKKDPERSYYDRVGVAFALRSGGFRLCLAPNVMVGDGVLLLPPKDQKPAEELPDEDIPF